VKKEPSDWESSKGIAKILLLNRVERRKYLGRFLAVTLLWMVLGLCVIDEWLAEDALRFLLWWGACGVLALILVVFALYDALSVIREEREQR